jgi:hypothetical protein
MRWKLIRRRLTISAPRVAVRSSLSWPLRWVGLAMMLGFCAAMCVWAYDLGKNFTGQGEHVHEELVRLRAEVARLREDRDKVQSVLNTSGSLITAERTAQERLVAQIRMLETENRALRDDLGFFEKLVPAGGTEAVAIRGLQAEVLGGSQLRWQVLVIQPLKNAPEFRGKLQLSLVGTLAGKPWAMDLPGGGQDLSFRQYRRLEGRLDLPEQAMVKNVSAKVVEGTATRAVHSIRLGA